MTSAIPGELNADQEQERKRKKRGAIIKFSLAGVALLGIGAAATSAAWTDDAWFKGTAKSALGSDIDLESSWDGSTWSPANDSGSAATLADSVQLTEITPGWDQTLTLHLKNNGKVPLFVTQTDADPDTAGNLELSGNLFTDNSATDPNDGPVAATLTFTSVELQPGDETTATLKVTSPSEWPTSRQGEEGAILVRFTGTTTGAPAATPSAPTP